MIVVLFLDRKTPAAISFASSVYGVFAGTGYILN
jgi:hypothetical protein